MSRVLKFKNLAEVIAYRKYLQKEPGTVFNPPRLPNTLAPERKIKKKQASQIYDYLSTNKFTYTLKTK